MKKLLLSLFLLSSISLYSQEEANFWYFGENAGLDFSAGSLSALNNGALSTDEGSASIANKNGELLFYTDGTTVYNKNHDILANGNGLLGNSSSAQSAIIVPKPLDPNIYYIFTVDREGGFSGVKYSEVDITKNGGLGEITSKNNSLNEANNAVEKITSIKGADCDTFWVITADAINFYAYLIDKNGVNTTAIVSSHNNNPRTLRGYLKVSPNGETLVNACNWAGTYIHDFNTSTGVVSNNRTLNIDPSENGYGVEFSRDSKKLYISTGTHSQLNTGLGIRNPPGPAKIYQYNLTSKDINNINASAKPIYITNNGYRGALQLATNGKIYYARSRQTSLGVINFPEKDANEVNFVENGFSLNGGICTEGLPPFIQSFFLPIEIKDPDTNQSINNQILQLCVGNKKSINPETLTDIKPSTTPSYQWTYDDGTSITPIMPASKSLNLTNIQKNNAGIYTLTVKYKDVCDNDIIKEATFNLEVYEAASATKPKNDIIFCDVDNDGFNTFDLSDTTSEILDGQDNTVFDVVYYLSQNDADNNTTAKAIPDPSSYTNPSAFSNQIIYARMHNKAAPNACYDVVTFRLAVTGKPKLKIPRNYEKCDDVEAGGDTDGYFNSFFLNTKDAEILDGLDQTLYEVSYHTSLNGAQTDKNTDVIDKIKPYRNTSINSQEIFVRVENINNAACNDTSISFFLVVNPLPVIANSLVTLKQCDTDADLNTTINLTLAEISISNNSINETFKYYPTQNDAINDTAEITNSSAHPVTHGDKIWARTISDKLCYRISEIDIVVGFAADITYGRSFELCDDFLDIDGNDNANNNDTDGITTFDLSEVETDIKNQFPAANRPNLDVLVFETIADRDAVQKSITNLANYRNKNVPAKTTQTLYIKVIDKTNNDCQGLSSFTILAQQAPIANDVEAIKQCDDFTSTSFDDGINVGINLRDKVNDILGASQTATDYTVTFHNKPEDANTGNNPIPNGNDPSNTQFINDTNYTNQTPNRETIYVRVVNNTTGCFNDHLKFDIIINPLPTINVDIPDLEVCDDGNDGSSINGLAQNIDLSLRDKFIIKKLNNNVNGYTISYHKTPQQAIDGTSAVDKDKYSNDHIRSMPPIGTAIDAPHTEVLHVSILNNDTQCRYGLATLTINTYPEPTLPDFISNYEACDNTSDTANSDTNGINGDISLSTKISEILANYPASEHGNFKVTFHDSPEKAQTGDDPIDEDQYENTEKLQPIYVRVENTKTSCANDNLSFYIDIKPLPNFTVNPPPVIVCLGEHVRLEALNPNAQYNYQWYNKNNPTNILSTDIFYNATEGGTYVVKATMQNTTGCERELEIVVDESEKPTLKEGNIVIIDDTNNSGLNTYSIRIITDNPDLDLGAGDYQFALEYIDNNGFNIQTPFQDEPLFENILGGFYTVVVNDKNGCQPDAKLEVSVIEYPKFLTPNGDGKNDTWKIKGANSSFYPASKITVVNRHGKIVAIIPIDSDGWDGTYNGKTLPSNDYWFRIQLVDRKGKIHQHQGHFALIRR